MASDVYREDIENILSVTRPWGRMGGTDVLVTGATGMIGSILVDVMARVCDEYGFTVTAMSRNMSELERLFSCHSDVKGLRLMSHDVNVPLDGQRFDTIIHLASNTHPRLYQSDPIGTITTNTIGLRNLLEAMSEGRGRFVFASSVEIYGQPYTPDDRFTEGYCGYIDCNTLRAGYNESKRLGEALCQAYAHSRGVDFVIPRLTRLYGPSLRKDDSKALSQFLNNAVAGQDITLKSKGEQVFSYCYSADAADAILFLLFNGESGKAYNVSGPEDSDISLRDLAGKIADFAGVDVVFDLPDESESKGYSPATRAIMDISRIKALGWSPRYSIDEGIRRTMDRPYR